MNYISFVVAAPVVTATVYAQSGTGGTGSFDVIQAIGSIGVGAVLAVPFVVVWRIAMKRIDLLEEEVRILHAARLSDVQGQVEREKALSDAMAPLLRNAAEALRDTPFAFDKVIEKAQSAALKNENDLRLRQIELAMDTMIRKLAGGEGDAKST